MRFSIAPALPRDNVKVLVDSLAVYNEVPEPPRNRPGGEWVEVERINPRYIEWQAAMKQLTAATYVDPEADAPLRKEQLRTYVRRCLVGCGPGGYQEALRQLRLRIRTYPPPNRNITEPDTQNFYLVTAVQSGVPAVLAFLWLVAGRLYAAGAAYRLAGEPLSAGVSLGCAGSMIGLLIANIFTPTLVHGLGPEMILVFALSAAVMNLVERTHRASSSS
jgi:hypothetical protein